MNVAHVFSSRVALHPQRVALADAATGRALTYAQLDAASARVAGAVRARGLRPGSTVLILHPVGIELYVALIGMLRAGLVPAIQPPGADRAALERCVRKHPPQAVLAGGVGWLAVAAVPALHGTTRLSTSFAPFAHDVLTADAAASGAIEPRDDDAPAMLTFTSGSTGDAKALVRSHGVARAQLEGLAKALALDGAVSLCTMPIVLLAELAAGATCLLPGVDLRRPGRFDAARLADTMRTHAVARIVASPALLANLAAALRARDAELPALRTIASGGAPVMPGLAGELRAVAPHARVVAVYGSTEAEPIAVLDANDIRADDLAAMRAGGGLLAGTPCGPGSIAIVGARHGAVFGPFPHDDDVERHALAPYGIGETVVAGPQVVEGYLDPAHDATTKIRAGARRWHRTGDLGYRDEGGRLWLVGRAAGAIDDARGAMQPLRVECALAALPGIA
ncbi:MAG: AMP-dependent synthetase and ligase, partial [Candidatus Eremiobacteraeota bacterium]|nr:AMP-dependent synthetase and ligase [Candidatus Eremiobacteraeota bacterium]